MTIISYLGIHNYFAAYEDSVEDSVTAPEECVSGEVGDLHGAEKPKEGGDVPLDTAQEPIGREELFELLCSVMLTYKTAFDVGRGAGACTVFHYGVTAKDHGAVMRLVLPTVYASATPDFFLMGGASIFHGVHNSVSCFRTRSNSWSTMPTMPTERRLSAVAVIGRRLHVVGGEKADVLARRYRQLPTAESYDPFAACWRQLPDMPTARAGCTGAAVGSMLYVFGGRAGDTVGAAAERFDTAVGRWERLPRLPTARSGCAAAALDGLLYVLGGKDGNGQVLAVVEVLDPQRGWWQVAPPMLVPRSACACGAGGGRLVVAGGFNGLEGVADVHSWRPAAGTWEALAPLNTWRIGAAAAFIEGQLYVLGGKTGIDSLMGERLDPRTNVWRWLPPAPTRHVYCVGAAIVSG